MKHQAGNVTSVSEGGDSGGMDRISRAHHSKPTSASPNIPHPWDQGGASLKGLRPSGRGCSAGLGPQARCGTWEAAFSLRDFLLPFNFDPAPSLPPAAPCASLFQDFVPLMAENFLQFSSLNLFMASVYFLFLCQACLLDLLPPQHFPCPHLFIESNLLLFHFSSFFFFFSQNLLSSYLLFQTPTFGQLSSLSLAVFQSCRPPLSLDS